MTEAFKINLEFDRVPGHHNIFLLCIR